MQRRSGTTLVSLVQGDLTRQPDIDAIVNAANSRLEGGSGVDGAIHRAGGPAILEECSAWVRDNGELAPGRAMKTTAGALPNRMIIHTVGPVWVNGYHGELIALERAWTRSMELAVAEGARTIAFPAISTGAYRFPAAQAALIAMNAVNTFCKYEHPGTLDEVRVVLFTEDALRIWEHALDQVYRTMSP